MLYKIEGKTTKDLIAEYETLWKNNTEELSSWLIFDTAPISDERYRLALFNGWGKPVYRYSGICYAGMKDNEYTHIIVPAPYIPQEKVKEEIDKLFDLLLQGDRWGDAFLNPNMEHVHEHGWWMDMSKPWQTVWPAMLLARNFIEWGTTRWVSRYKMPILNEIKTPVEAEDYICFCQYVTDYLKRVHWCTAPAYHGNFWGGRFPSYQKYRDPYIKTHTKRRISPVACKTDVREVEPFCSHSEGSKSLKPILLELLGKEGIKPPHVGVEEVTFNISDMPPLDLWHFFQKNKWSM